MHQFLQWLGGGFYLLNKAFFFFMEGAHDKKLFEEERRWRIASWVVYLIGLPAFVILFAGWRNWIVAFVEASMAPAMVLGLMIALRRSEKKVPRWLDWLALVFVPIGLFFSFRDIGGFHTLNQWLEIGLVGSGLIGTYLLAKKRRSGYLWYVLMHVSCGWLFLIQDAPWLFFQQIASLGFILASYRRALRRARTASTANSA